MRYWTIALSLVLVLALTAAASACPACKDSVGNDEAAVGTGGNMGTPGSGLPGGFNTSVYFMLCGFLGTLGLVSFVVVRGIRGSAPGAGFPVTPVGRQDRRDDTTSPQS